MTDTTKDAGNTEVTTSDKSAQSACNGLLCEFLIQKGSCKKEVNMEFLHVEKAVEVIEKVRKIIPNYCVWQDCGTCNTNTIEDRACTIYARIKSILEDI